MRTRAKPFRPKGKAKERTRKAIWNAFLATELSDFEGYMGYGKKAIERIGVKAFVEHNGWYTPDDVAKWRTDKLHVHICLHCEKRFVVFMLSNNMGICDHCLPEYDLDRFFDMYMAYAAGEGVVPAKAQALWVGFLATAEIRELFQRTYALAHLVTKNSVELRLAQEGGELIAGDVPSVCERPGATSAAVDAG